MVYKIKAYLLPFVNLIFSVNVLFFLFGFLAATVSDDRAMFELPGKWAYVLPFADLGCEFGYWMKSGF